MEPDEMGCIHTLSKQKTYQTAHQIPISPKNSGSEWRCISESKGAGFFRAKRNSTAWFPIQKNECLSQSRAEVIYMIRIRIRVTILAAWLICLYILGRLLDPIVISSITIGFVFVIVVSELLIPRMPRNLVWVIMFVTITALLVTSLWTRDLAGGVAILQMFTEIGAIVVTAMLSLWVSRGLDEFENAVAYITLGQSEEKLDSPLSGQGLIYREVRRARNHQQPLALISIGVDEKSIEPATEKLVRDIQRSMMKRYKLQGLSKMLRDELEDCAVIVQDSDHYLAVLPDTKTDEIPVVVERLRQKACGQVGVELKIGVATLPQDSYTFEGLVERANQEMLQDREPQPCVVMDKFPVEHRIIE